MAQCGLIATLICCLTLAGGAADSPGPAQVQVADGIVQPRRPVAEAIAQGMEFLKKADGAYVPGRIDGELAGYFTSAHVNPDGSRSGRKVSFPARQHAYFIFTFLMYHGYTGEPEWRLRARDLGDWNLTHSTPASAAYPNLPYSTFFDGKPGGSRDVDSIEPDKAAFFGSAYLGLHEATADARYLDAARAIGKTLANTQREDGSWPFRVVPESGVVRQDFGGAPVFFVEFFEKLARYDDTPANRRAGNQALKLMLQRNVEKNLWGTYHEDIGLKQESYLSAEPMSFTAAALFRQAGTRPEYVPLGRQVLARMEDRLVYTNGHAAAPAPAVSEQAGFEHLMPGHTARYCMALSCLYLASGEDQVRRRALSGFSAVTYMQSPPGLFRTFFYSVKPGADTSNRPDWYSQHLYTVCHVLESMACLPELAPDGEDHVLSSDIALRKIGYSSGRISFETIKPSREVVKLGFAPKAVYVGKAGLPQLNEPPSAKQVGWFFSSAKDLLTLRHDAGQVEILKSPR